MDDWGADPLWPQNTGRCEHADEVWYGTCEHGQLWSGSATRHAAFAPSGGRGHAAFSGAGGEHAGPRRGTSLSIVVPEKNKANASVWKSEVRDHHPTRPSTRHGAARVSSPAPEPSAQRSTSARPSAQRPAPAWRPHGARSVTYPVTYAVTPDDRLPNRGDRGPVLPPVAERPRTAHSTSSAPSPPPLPSSATTPATTSPTTMASPRRPLPTPPVSSPRREWDAFNYPSTGLPGGHPDLFSYGSPYMSPYPFQSNYTPTPPASPQYEAPSATLRGGTLLHKGFYDLLALIPSTPSPSRLFWPRSQNAPGDELISGPRYEEIPTPDAQRAVSPPASPVSPPAPRNLKTRRISKDMVSKPTGFMYVIACGVSGISTNVSLQPSRSRI